LSCGSALGSHSNMDGLAWLHDPATRPGMEYVHCVPANENDEMSSWPLAITRGGYSNPTSSSKFHALRNILPAYRQLVYGLVHNGDGAKCLLTHPLLPLDWPATCSL